MSLNFDV